MCLLGGQIDHPHLIFCNFRTNEFNDLKLCIVAQSSIREKTCSDVTMTSQLDVVGKGKVLEMLKLNIG